MLREKLWGLSFVSAKETLRLYPETLAKTSAAKDEVESCSTEILKKATLSPDAVGGRRYLPVDFDVATLDNTDSRKAGVCES